MKKTGHLHWHGLKRSVENPEHRSHCSDIWCAFYYEPLS